MENAKLVSIRVPADLAARLAKATSKKSQPYPPTTTAIFLRGLALALKEIEAK